MKRTLLTCLPSAALALPAAAALTPGQAKALEEMQLLAATRCPNARKQEVKTRGSAGVRQRVSDQAISGSFVKNVISFILHQLFYAYCVSRAGVTRRYATLRVDTLNVSNAYHGTSAG
ncbi:hypothetical protein ACFDR9_005581 [Janthinobacterium sp. CG_23.3]